MDNETDKKPEAIINNYDYSKLPPHVITNIFTYLPVYQITNSAVVCRTWYDASLSVEITKKIAVYVHPNQSVDGLLDTNTNLRPFGSVYFRENNFSRLDYRPFFNTFSKNIRHIEFTGCYIEFSQLLEYLELLNKLNSLTIHMNTNSNFTIKYDVNITDVLEKNLSGIKTLVIKCHDLNAFKAANFILGKCKNLDSLTYVIPMQHNNDNFVPEVYQNMIIAMDQWQQVDLKYLSIENHESNECNAFFTSFQILNVIRINKLNLRNIRTGYDPMNFNEFCARMYDIRDLDVDIKTHSNLSFICKHLINLTRLSINAMPIKNIGVIEDLHNLEVLEVAAFDVPQEDLLKIFNARMPNLRKLSLNIMILNKTCLIALCNNFKKLEYLNLTLNTRCYYPIFKNLHNLKHLTIYWEENENDDDGLYDDEEDCNISELQNLERLYVDVLVPGMTSEQIGKLPNLKFFKCMADLCTTK